MKGVVVEQFWWGDIATGSRQALLDAHRLPASLALPGDPGCVPKRILRITRAGKHVARTYDLDGIGGLVIERKGRDRYEVKHRFDITQVAVRWRHRELQKAATRSRELIDGLPCTEDQYRQRIERLLHKGAVCLLLDALEERGGFSVKRDSVCAVVVAFQELRETLQEVEVEFHAAARSRQIEELRIRTNEPETDAQLQRLIGDCMRTSNLGKEDE